MPAPTGEESCDDAVAPKRSRRRRPSGRSAHHQRPFGRGLGQTHNGDQGDPEGPSGETGQAPATMKPPLPTPGQLAPPPCPAASRIPPLHRALVCQRDGSERDEVRTRVAIGPRCWQIRADTTSSTAHLDDDLAVGHCPLPPPDFPPHQRSLGKDPLKPGATATAPMLERNTNGDYACSACCETRLG